MSDCPPCPKAIPAGGDPAGHITASAGVGGVRKRKPRQLRGTFCVVGKKSGRKFNCFRDRETAEKMVERLGRSRFEIRGPK